MCVWLDEECRETRNEGVGKVGGQGGYDEMGCVGKSLR